jgi:nucleoid-associated protein YgaU
MPTRVKIAASAGIVLAGLLLAMLFRQSPRTGPTDLSADDSLVLRQRAEPPKSGGAGTASSGKSVIVSPAPASQPPTVLKPLGGSAPPPERPDLTAPASPKGTSRWGISMGQVLPEAGGAPSALKHKIVDGDNLPALAERYLGSTDRAMEIFEANRDELSDPRILPIGLEIRIPPRDGPVATAPAAK